jgi:nitrogen fixation/metabolism regulation signal transduction histidine kinase
MNSISLRWRFIFALMALTLATTVALSLIAQYFLDSSLDAQRGMRDRTGQTFADALSLAKESYTTRKDALMQTGMELFDAPMLLDSFHRLDLQQIRQFLMGKELSVHSQRLLTLETLAEEGLVRYLGPEPTVFKDPGRANLLQLFVPIRENGKTIGVFVATTPLDELLRMEEAAQALQYFDMIEGDLREKFILAFLVAAAALLLIACIVGIRTGFGVTNSLTELVKGTTELARDNLDYRIPAGRDDEIGKLIKSFNLMAEDLKQNRKLRVEAEKIAAWREIARRLAHEIKNPLTPIQLTVQQMRDKYKGSDAEYRKLVSDCTEIVTEEVESLRTLVQEFAEFARMPTLSLGRHDLNQVLQDVTRLYPESRIRLVVNPSLPELDLDSEQMRRVMINLVENGLDAAGESGVIRIRASSQGEFVKLVVSDNGIGVPQVDRERIFQPYVSSKNSGMGLGLAVVRSIIENHRGTITVTDSPDGGAQFEIEFPIPDALLTEPEVQT